jgi:hypothetical protein
VVVVVAAADAAAIVVIEVVAATVEIAATAGKPVHSVRGANPSRCRFRPSLMLTLR